jgi:hypothetical protein
MTHKARRAVVAAAAPQWRSAYTEALLGQGFDVHTASTARELLDLLRKHTYDTLAVDVSLEDMELVEACLTAVDLSPGRPSVVVSGVRPPEVRPIMSWCNIRFAGPREGLLRWFKQEGLPENPPDHERPRCPATRSGTAHSRTQPASGRN